MNKIYLENIKSVTIIVTDIHGNKEEYEMKSEQIKRRIKSVMYQSLDHAIGSKTSELITKIVHNYLQHPILDYFKQLKEEGVKMVYWDSIQYAIWKMEGRIFDKEFKDIEEEEFHKMIDIGNDYLRNDEITSIINGGTDVPNKAK